MDDKELVIPIAAAVSAATAAQTAAISTDIKWIMRAIEENARANNTAHKEIITHLARLNGQTAKNTTRSTVNRYGLAINFSIVVVVVTILLHLMGVY